MTRQKKQTISVMLTAAELKILDAAVERHGVSRPAIIGALLKLHGAEDLTGKVAARKRRPGAGRPKKPPEHPFEFLRHIVPELLKP